MTENNIVSLVRRDPSLPAAFAAASGSPEAQRFGIAEFMLMLRRHATLVLVIFGTVCGAGAVFTLSQTPTYSATALLMINPNPDQIVPDKQSLASSKIEAGMLDSEIEVLKSPTLAARLAGELKLGADPEWNPALRNNPARPTATDARALEVGPEARARLGQTDARQTPGTNPDVSDDTIDTLTEAMDIRRRGLSYVVEISANSQSPEMASRIANGLSRVYLASLVEERQASSDKANLWLKQRVDELNTEVQQKLVAAQGYRAQHNLLTAQGVSLVEQQVAQLQSSLLQTRAEYAQKRSEYAELAGVVGRGETVGAPNAPGNTDSMRELRLRRAELAQRVADLQKRYGPNYPAMKQAREEEIAVDAQLISEMARVADKSRIELQSLGARLSTQESELDSLRGQLVNDNFDQVRLNGLETDAEGARSVYESFLQRYHEVAGQGNFAGISARLLSPARPPRQPTSPHLMLNGAIAFTAAVMLALLSAVLADQFRRNVETTEDIEQKIGARALVAVPALRNHDMRRLPAASRNPANYLLAKRMSPFAEALRVLQTSIFLSNQTPNKVVAVTSAMPGEGKTTLSLSLARIAAMGGQKVIIVDCDIRMRSLNRVLEMRPAEGLQHVLSGDRSWRDVVGCDKPSGAHVLPAAEDGITYRDLFGSGAMEILIGELAQEYDLVLLDCAPVFAVADTRRVGAMVDAVIVAARAGRTPARALAGAISQLEIAGAKVLGVVLNRVDMRRGQRSFYDGLYYSKAFSGYYVRQA